MAKYIKSLSFIMLIATMFGCTTGKPNNIEAVTPFVLNKYLGTWHEIARMDHSFERDLDYVTATYSMNEDGSVKVVNRGFNTHLKEWKEAIGKAKFVEDDNVGYLKVSFFGPFYGSYIIFYLEPDYSTALISSYNHDYFWLLSRHKQISPQQLERYINIAKKAGFDTDKLIYPKQ